MSILMLQPLAVERCSTRCTPKQKTARHHIGRSPNHVADTLKAKHGIKNIKRDRRYGKRRISSASSNERGNRTGFTDALL